MAITMNCGTCKNQNTEKCRSCFELSNYEEIKVTSLTIDKGIILEIDGENIHVKTDKPEVTESTEVSGPSPEVI